MAACEALLQMEHLGSKGGENANAATLFVALATAFEKVQLIVVWQCATWFEFPPKSVKSSLWVL